jgi:glycosyltransferase involved in cell wall biosynthesis
MEAFLAETDLSNRFHMPGAKPGVSIELETMDLFMLTSKFEGLPNVILEAQFYGLPVVATDAGGTREAFEQNVTGLLAEDPTPESLADYAGLFLASHARISRANGRAPKFVSKDFGLDRMIRETLDLYNLTETTPND